MKFYITTAIDYVNAEPHIGHAYEKVLADVVARWHRLLGDDVLFVTGTDDNASKNEDAAKKANVPVRAFVDKNAERFVELCRQLNLSNDDFIRTTEARHVKVAQAIFKKVYEKGDIYKGMYEGLYCKGCEAFYSERELENGKCPEHKVVPELVSEESYFFRLSKYKDKVLKLVEAGLVVPAERQNEVLARLRNEDVKDLSVTRVNQKWGIPCPIDPKHTIYVWFDALLNYYSATRAKGKEKYWPADMHMIGKGISWFHAVIWPAMLLSAGLEQPKKVVVHGYLTANGQKIGKSLGNVVNPYHLIEKYGVDQVRYFLLREIPFGADGDFSEDALKARINGELANKLGNLVSRVSTLVEKYGIEKVKVDIHTQNVEIKELMYNYELDRALNSIFAFIDTLNELVQEKKPWETHNKKDLYELVTGIRLATILLSPFIPETAEKIAKTFNFKISLKELNKSLKESKIKKSVILFKKVQ